MNTPINLASIDEAIEDSRAGKVLILVDDEDRENEGDFVVAAEKVTPEIVNFMARFGRGLVCLTIEEAKAKELRLTPMAQHNQSKFQTNFTVSIEAKEGVTTGISASDRAQTIKAAIELGAEHIVSPGHIFPIVAKEGGVMVRAGHTEATVDLARLAGLKPAGVLCEIMNDDGTMARLPNLVNIAAEHGLKIATIRDLIAYRARKESLVECIAETVLHSSVAGKFRMLIYREKHEGLEHIVLQKGELSSSEPVLVRMHALDILADVLADNFDGKQDYLRQAMQMLESKGSGVIVLLRSLNPQAISQQIEARKGLPDMHGHGFRDYGVGAQILVNLGIKEMNLLTNSKREPVGLEGYGLKIVQYIPMGALCA